MALPETGGTYEDILQPGLNDNNVRKGIVTDLLIREYNSSATRLDVASVGLNARGRFTPYAEDGELRDDLIITATGPNLGFYHLGLMGEEGFTFTPDMNIEKVRSAQSRNPVRVDITEESDSIKLIALEANPIVDCIRDRNPFSSMLDLGAAGYDSPKAAFARRIEYQAIALMFDGKHYAAKVFPRLNIADQGDSNWNVADADRLEITLEALLCPFAKYRVNTLREGEGWRGQGGYPVFAGSVTATATGAGAATVAHAVPTGLGDPWTYAVESAATSAGPWTSATVANNSLSGGNITHTLSGLSAGAKVFRVTATGSNLLSATSSVSNSVTITS
ncbi:hypothetical protein SAMN04488581_2604 [Mycolicibacterium neoaurum]|uniref:hypothetical protein n=1 Tax=Mycolicibacterium neoaurum TaxID=1795 RepID=UPI00055ECC2B|nr:hypothetical protein [Mycolicibacterium neoaurum]SDD58787.1 hypothetical protein SAMN04488581_2604 [Mycolicibacterium neoaurum]